MNNENRGKRQPAQWEQVKGMKDEQSGAQVVIKKSDYRHHPSVEFSIGQAHGKTSLFTPHNLIRYENDKPLDLKQIDDYFDGLQRLREEVKAAAIEAVTAIQKTLPKQRPQGQRKPGEPGKTGKTARKKAAKMTSSTPTPKPAMQPEA